VVDSAPEFAATMQAIFDARVPTASQ
jgi:hypothetical protein